MACQLCFAQKASPYGIIFCDSLGNKKTNQKKEVINYLQSFENRALYLHGEDLFLFSPLHEEFGVQDLTDTLFGIYKIKNRIVKRDNYLVVKNRLKRCRLYLIDIENTDGYNQSPTHIRLMLLKKRESHLKKGKCYAMTIAPIVKKDCCGPVIDSSGKLFYRMQHPGRSRSTIIYKKMLIPYIDITGYNYYELLNAKKRPPMNEKNCHHGSQSRTFQKRICLLMGMRIVGDHLSGTAQTFKYSDAPLSEDFARTAHRFGL